MRFFAADVIDAIATSFRRPWAGTTDFGATDGLATAFDIDSGTDDCGDDDSESDEAGFDDIGNDEQ